MTGGRFATMSVMSRFMADGISGLRPQPGQTCTPPGASMPKNRHGMKDISM